MTHVMCLPHAIAIKMLTTYRVHLSTFCCPHAPAMTTWKCYFNSTLMSGKMFSRGAAPMSVVLFTVLWKLLSSFTSRAAALSFMRAPSTNVRLSYDASSDAHASRHRACIESFVSFIRSIYLFLRPIDNPHCLLDQFQTGRAAKFHR